MVTLKDVARECGVSFSTVSKALKGSAEISAETIRLIKEKASEMGYHPNVAARTLRTNRTYDIGVIFEDKTGSGFQHQYFAKIISGLQSVAQREGYEITFTGSAPGRNFDYYNHIKARNFDGVAVLSADFRRDDICRLVHSEIPSVVLDYVYDDGHSAVLSDNTSGMTELAEYAVAMGHRRIAMIHGENTLVTAERRKAFLNVMKRHSINVPGEYFAEGLYNDPITSSDATEILMSLPEPPTCIFYPDDYSALGGIRELNSLGLSPGKDISIVGYDGILLTSMIIPPLTTYEQNGESIGKFIGERLISDIENGAPPERTRRLVTGRLLKGGTVVRLA